MGFAAQPGPIIRLFWKKLHEKLFPSFANDMRVWLVFMHSSSPGPNPSWALEQMLRVSLQRDVMLAKTAEDIVRVSRRKKSLGGSTPSKASVCGWLWQETLEVISMSLEESSKRRRTNNAQVRSSLCHATSSPS